MSCLMGAVTLTTWYFLSAKHNHCLNWTFDSSFLRNEKPQSRLGFGSFLYPQTNTRDDKNPSVVRNKTHTAASQISPGVTCGKIMKTVSENNILEVFVKYFMTVDRLRNVKTYCRDTGHWINSQLRLVVRRCEQFYSLPAGKTFSTLKQH